MHSITLSFATLTELAAAVAKLTATGVVEAPAAPAPGKPKAEKPAPPPAAAEPAAPAPTPAPSPKTAAAAPAPAEKGIEYPVLQKAVFELSALVQKRGLDAGENVLAIAQAHGAPNFKLLDPSVYAAALADVKAKIAEVAALEEAVA